jgi:hypothetical protein
MSGKLNTKLDGNQVLREVYNDANESLQVSQIGGNLVPEQYDSINLTYVTSGFGIGEIATVVYIKDATPIATLTLSYNASNKLSSVVRT